MKKGKRSEDALLEAFLLRAIEAEDPELQKTPEEPLDEETDERLKRLIRAAYRKDCIRRKWKRGILKVSACVAITLTVSFAVVMNVEAWRTGLLNYTISAFEEYGTFYVQNEKPDEERIRYLPSEIPDGFEQKDIIVDTESTLAIKYENKKKGRQFAFYIYYEPTNIKFDTEGVEMETDILEGQESIILIKDEKAQALGRIPGTDYQYGVVGDLTEELYSIVYSIQPVIK